MLLRTSETKHTLVTRLTLEGNVISILHPQKDETLISVAKSLGYTWHYPAWKRAIDTRWSGSVNDRYVEIAHILLEKGFLIDVCDSLVECIINAEYSEEQRRWIKVITGTKRVVIQWPRNDDLYRAAKSLPGATYDAPYVTVPLTSWRDVRDFAGVHRFSISPMAEQLLSEAETEYEQSILVIPKKRVNKKPHIKNETFGVDESLRDD